MPSTKQNLLFLLDLLRANAGLKEDELFFRLQQRISKGMDPTDEDWTLLRNRIQGHTEELLEGPSEALESPESDDLFETLPEEPSEDFS